MQNKITNSLLAIIAACLVIQVIHSLVQKPIPVKVQTQEKSTAFSGGTLDVRIVDVSQPLKVDLSTMAGEKLDVENGEPVLPVAVRNTIVADANITGVGGDLKHVPIAGDGIPVVILNQQ
jgi:hypothetical protein